MQPQSNLKHWVYNDGVPNYALSEARKAHAAGKPPPCLLYWLQIQWVDPGWTGLCAIAREKFMCASVSNEASRLQQAHQVTRMFVYHRMYRPKLECHGKPVSSNSVFGVVNDRMQQLLDSRHDNESIVLAPWQAVNLADHIFPR